MVEDKHVIEALGKVRVVIENGQITEVGESLGMNYCPMFHAMHNVEELNEEFIRKNIQFRIDDFGMCTPQRIVEMDDVVTVGVSEIIKTNLENGNIDCVVGACDGAGTLLMTNPRVVQGVGARVSGLVSTTPIPEVIQKLEEADSIILNPETAELNQLEGLKLALEKGYKNIAITILPSPMVEEIRQYPVDDDVNVYIFVAHTTGACYEDVEMLFKNADIITACASKEVRRYTDEYKPYYYGNKVPIFCASETGRKFLDIRLEKINKPLSTNNYPRAENDEPNELLWLKGGLIIRKIFFDTETTGLDCKNCQIIELAMLTVEDGNVVEEYDEFVKVGIPLNPKITELTGITDDDLENKGKSEKEIAGDLKNRITKDTLMIAHNAQFDLSFVYYMLKRHFPQEAYEIVKNAYWLDTLTVLKDRKDYPHKLIDAVEHYRVEKVNFHRAIDDTKALYEVSKMMKNERNDLDEYIDIFGYNPKWGVSGIEFEFIDYRKQPYHNRGKLPENLILPRMKKP